MTRKILPIALLTLALIVCLKSVAVAWDTSSNQESVNVVQISSRSASPHHIALAGTWQFQVEQGSDASIASLHPAASPDLPPLPADQWQPITVPSNWYLQGYDHAGAAWYQYRFQPVGQLQNRVIKLAFEGVDYAADVWLNGQYLGFHEGYFQPFTFWVSNALKFDQINLLTVRVNSPQETRQTDWSLHKRMIKGIFSHHDARPGGAWSEQAQDKNTGGIWAPVSLVVSEQLAIDAIKITPHLALDQNQATAEVEFTVTNPGQESIEVQADLQLVPENFARTAGQNSRTTLQIHPGENHFTLQVEQNSPQLWWTWDHGKPNLYRLQLKLLKQGQILDQQDEVFGFRSIQYDFNAKVWLLNNQRIFPRGTNYIATQWLSEMTSDKFAQDINLIKQANINSIRVHAHVTAPLFYQLCDRAGLLIWQDFPLQWGYQDDAEFAAEAVQQGQDMINLLYNHPSIMAWSLHNEPPWDAGWMQDKYEQYDPDQNKYLDEVLYTHLKGLDLTRHLHQVSSVAEHPWWGWYSGSFKQYAAPTEQPLITEFGAQALPNLPSLQKMFTEAELFPDSEAEWAKWQYHNFQPHETFDIAQVPMGRNVTEFIDNTQRYQAQVIQFAAEAYRRQRFQPVSAIFQFMFVECWSSINWGMVDYWRQPKPGYEALKIAYQPVLPSIAWMQQTWKLGETVSLDLWAINDRWAAFPNATLTYTLKRDRQLVLQQQLTFDLPADSGLPVHSFVYQPQQTGNYKLNVSIVDHKGHQLGYNCFEFAVNPSSE